MKHLLPCSGCPACNTELRSLLTITPDQYSAWLTKHTLRTAGARSELHTGIHLEDTMENDIPVPDPYAAPLAALRAANATPPTAEERFAGEYAEQRRREFAATAIPETATKTVPELTAAELAAYDPPDSYAAGLKKLRENR